MIPPISEIHDLLYDEERCVDFLIKNKILATREQCSLCKKPFHLQKHQGLWRCGKCKTSISIRKDSFFADHKISFSKILLIGYLWLTKVPTTSIITMTGCSSKTICNFQNHFRQLITDTLEPQDDIIGGEGIVVEIDETKMGKRKYNRGRHVDGAWIVGGVERTNERKVFLVEVTERSANTLTSIIMKHVKPGSIIHTDMWKGYSKLSEINYKHFTVNHSKGFKDLLTQVYFIVNYS